VRRRDLVTMIGCAAVAWPQATPAQVHLPIIGFVGLTSANAIEPRLAAFRAGLKENGFVEGLSIDVEYRYADGQISRMPALVAELLRQSVSAVITAPGTPAALEAARTTPVVFTTGSDPVADGLVPSLSRPGGHATGATFYSALLQAKQFELLRELVPDMKVTAVMSLPATSSDKQFELLQSAARAGDEIVRLDLEAAIKLDALFATIRQRRADAMIVNNPVANQQIDRVVAFAAENRIPTIYGIREFPAAGGLMSYGASINDTYRQVGVYAGRILRGTDPSDLPVVQPTKFELVINLKTAKALGLTIPPTLLARADEVIE